MKNFFYSVVIIAYTVFISAVFISVNKGYNIDNENSLIAKELEIKIYKKDSNKEEQVDNEGNDDVNLENYINFEEKERIRRREKEKYIKDDYIKDGYISTVNETDYKIIKTSVENIERDLSIIEKAKLAIISEDLSNTDIEKISQYIGYRNEKVGVEKIIELMEEKLKPKDVEYVVSVFSRYVDFSSLNKK